MGKAGDHGHQLQVGKVEACPVRPEAAVQDLLARKERDAGLRALVGTPLSSSLVSDIMLVTHQLYHLELYHLPGK